jgi:CubicO group peptidase (beta-lactamase class C family)
MKIQKISIPILIGLLIFNYSVKSQTYPGNEWTYNNDPFSDGWNAKKFNEFHQYLIDSTYITGLQIIHRGRIVFEFGDVKENGYIASCRKSILAILYGKYVKNGQIDLDKTLEKLQIDDVGGLLAIEKKATIKNLITARSGVYHAEAFPGGMGHYAPERGSKEPGSYWLYNNWDFNVSFHLFEQETGKDTYDEIENQLVKPLNMQDWDRSLQIKYGDTSLSKFITYPMWFSTRDMSRIGLLMLNRGKWKDKQLIDEEWIEEMTTQWTTAGEVNTNVPSFRDGGVDFGYGYMWWLWENSEDPRVKGAYSALGRWGQSITIFPAIDAVVVFKTKKIYERSNSTKKRTNILKKAVETYDYNIDDNK